MKKSRKRVTCAAAIAGMLSVNMVGLHSAEAYDYNNGMFYNDEYESLEDTLDAAGQLAEEVAAEGNVLLKNENNALPLANTAKVSIFGSGSDGMGGTKDTTISLADALKEEGVQVNPSLEKLYASTETNRAETEEFNAQIENTYRSYNDAAIIVLSVQAGGEGYGDASVNTGEVNGEADIEHADSAHSLEEPEVSYKHEMQLTDGEMRLLNYVKAQGFKKIIYVVSSEVPIEMSLIQEDEAVDAVLWTGWVSENGNRGTAKILTGEISPSGKTVDTWYKDFTADPTWANVGSGLQHEGEDGVVSSSKGLDPYGNSTELYSAITDQYCGVERAIGGSGYNIVDYEEDIYVGYRYYETRGYEEYQKTGNYDWYDNSVVYPFGYGLSYTTFAYSDMSVTLDNGEPLVGNIDKALLESFDGHEAQVKSASASVTVTNTGTVSGKEIVELYATAPYTGALEKSHVVLIGYAKTDELQPGQSQTVTISFNLQDLASYDAQGAAGDVGYALEAGTYTIRAMANANGWAQGGDNYAEQSFDLSETAYQKLDDYSGNEVKNLFSAENGLYYTMRDNNGDREVSVSSAMTRLSRADFEGTMPTALTLEDVTLSMQTIYTIMYLTQYSAEAQEALIAGEDYEFPVGIGSEEGVTEGVAVAHVSEDGNVYVDINGDGEYTSDELILNRETDIPWLENYLENQTDMQAWTQEEDDEVVSDIQLAQLSGIPYTDEVLSEGEFSGRTGKDVWDEYMNSFSFDELNELVFNDQKVDYAEKGLNKLAGSDNCYNYGGTYQFSSQSVLAATWNNEMSYAQGRMIGNIAIQKGNNTWWGPGTQIHKHYFAGRNAEYFSEDAFLSGTMGAMETQGASSVGVACIIKHAFLNDQETNRAGICPLDFVSEQALREIYAKSFQIAFQEGGAQGLMTAFARIGLVPSVANYNALVAMIQEQWGCENVSMTSDMYIGVQRAGNQNLFLYGGLDNMESGTEGTGCYWNSDFRDGLGGVEMEDGTQNDFVYYTLRTRARNWLMFHCNTVMNKNGLRFADDWTDGEAQTTQDFTQGVDAAGVSFAADFNAVKGYATIEYAIADGELPEGLILNETTGEITGIPTGSGEYEVTVSCRIDGLVSGSKKFFGNVAPAFALEDGYTAAINENVDVFIVSDIFSVDDGYVYNAVLKEGELPAGVILGEDGSFSGIAEASGDFDLVVTIEVTDNAGTLVGTYDAAITLTIK